MKNKKKFFEKIAVYILARLTIGTIIAGYTNKNNDYYLLAFLFGFIFFRITTGSSCLIIWLLSKMGVKGLNCSLEQKKY
ncbi:MAG: hypothetical protein KKD35_00975 [Elusimicrobia bacterium]|nr:hypothetical protein [Elusimicrobiota bacterium]